MFETIKTETDARGIARLTLARSEKHNALSEQMMEEITAAIGQLGSDDAVRVVILAAEGRSFCAGGDLKWMQSQIAAGAKERAAAARKLAGMLQALNTCPKPVIGAVQGNAFGGGIGMMSVCDVAIGVEGAKFGLTETRLGLTPATISPYVVARMGEARARRVFMSSRIFEAAEARDLGLLAKVVLPEVLERAVMAEAEPYLACAPGAVGEAKALVRALGPRIDESVIDMTIEALVTRWESAESDEGITAFFEKRDAAWKA
ncbi:MULTISPECIES: crotonase/enoyl-CoA hydratase family protein [Thioclava]|uniref:Crotonase/enoyl-CoA hydratase family protein n=1 Tax=Thioclava electrotropha TaxID=1549850 RepID=A0ABX6YSA4_9RHOB|nr:MULTISPECIES: crotonase/enoyl-CoA hydratase family protein [Thioclava]OOY21368.1 enoyl-CoA hydratase [Thioclava sp. DLFJ5-1]OOY33253.1 enoyl-CoA hydratase [Thioclava sp. F36-6]QPZ90709.1 crotonase/enoyl-CoA hydratase family protein [Thioclava electrotropha]